MRDVKWTSSDNVKVGEHRMTLRRERIIKLTEKPFEFGWTKGIYLKNNVWEESYRNVNNFRKEKETQKPFRIRLNLKKEYFHRLLKTFSRVEIFDGKKLLLDEFLLLSFLPNFHVAFGPYEIIKNFYSKRQK